jgi:hypothetical protein
MKRLARTVVVFALLLSSLLLAQTPTGTVTVNTATSIVVSGSNGASPAVRLDCTITPNAAKTLVIGACTGIPVLSLDVSLPGESVTYALNLNGNALTLMFTQSTPAGTLTFQVAVNGVAKSGTF